MDLQTINESTPISDFPEIYNKNIDELVNEINRLNNVISAKDGEIRTLRNTFQRALADLRAEYIRMFADLEDTYVKKDTTNSD